MASVLKLEDFEPSVSGALQQNLDTESDPTIDFSSSLEDHRLEAFEQGYKAGWDDATKAQNDDRSRISGDFERNLQDLSFTYHEARNQVLRDLRPLFGEMVSKILPHLASEGFAELVVQSAVEQAENLPQSRVELVAAPANRFALETLLDKHDRFEIHISEEPSLAEGQAYLRFADQEQQFDLDSVMAKIKAAVDGFFQLNEMEEKHG